MHWNNDWAQPVSTFSYRANDIRLTGNTIFVFYWNFHGQSQIIQKILYFYKSLVKYLHCFKIMNAVHWNKCCLNYFCNVSDTEQVVWKLNGTNLELCEMFKIGKKYYINNFNRNYYFYLHWYLGEYYYWLSSPNYPHIAVVFVK